MKGSIGHLLRRVMVSEQLTRAKQQINNEEKKPMPLIQCAGTRLRTCSAVTDCTVITTSITRCTSDAKVDDKCACHKKSGGKRNRLTSVREAATASMARRRFSALRVSSKYSSPYAFQLSPPSSLFIRSPNSLS